MLHSADDVESTPRFSPVKLLYCKRKCYVTSTNQSGSASSSDGSSKSRDPASDGTGDGTGSGCCEEGDAKVGWTSGMSLGAVMAGSGAASAGAGAWL